MYFSLGNVNIFLALYLFTFRPCLHGRVHLEPVLKRDWSQPIYTDPLEFGSAKGRDQDSFCTDFKLIQYRVNKALNLFRRSTECLKKYWLTWKISNSVAAFLEFQNSLCCSKQKMKTDIPKFKLEKSWSRKSLIPKIGGLVSISRSIKEGCIFSTHPVLWKQWEILLEYGFADKSLKSWEKWIFLLRDLEIS